MPKNKRATVTSPNFVSSPIEPVSQVRLSSGHDFSRAVDGPKSVRLQPLRDGICGCDTDSIAQARDPLLSRGKMPLLLLESPPKGKPCQKISRAI
jgi:hypothetical protein